MLNNNMLPPSWGRIEVWAYKLSWTVVELVSASYQLGVFTTFRN